MTVNWISLLNLIEEEKILEPHEKGILKNRYSKIKRNLHFRVNTNIQIINEVKMQDKTDFG